MGGMFFKDLLQQAESGAVTAAIPAATYDVQVTEARPKADSSMIFLTIGVLSGPQAGKQADVSLWFPGEGSKPSARVFFARKIKGFLAYPDVQAAFQSADNAPTIEQGFELIAQAITNKQVSADIGVSTKGDYAGSNELRSTKPIQGPTQPAPQAAAPAPAPQPVPAAAAPAPAPAPAPVPAAVPQGGALPAPQWDPAPQAAQPVSPQPADPTPAF